MEQIRETLEYVISMAGVTGTAVAVMSHALLVLCTFIIAMLVDYLCRRFVVPLIVRLTARTGVEWDDKIFNRTVLISACHIVSAVIVWQLLPLVFAKFRIVEEILGRLTEIYITVMTVRTAIVFIDSFKALEGDRRTAMQQYFHSFCGIFKIAMIFIAAIIVVSIIFDRSPLRLFAGLGATSAVLMLVFKDTIEGFVAGIRLTSNNMIHKGDWITVPTTSANGIVEEMTLSTVKIRNFDNTIVTVSPQTLVNGSFQNWIGMQQSDGRRVNRRVYYDFNSVRVADGEMKRRLAGRGFFRPEELEGQHVNITLYRRYVEKYLYGCPEVNTSMIVMVRQFEATVTGLPLEFYFFLREKEWLTYEHQLADIMDRVYALAPEFGLRIYQKFPAGGGCRAAEAQEEA